VCPPMYMLMSRHLSTINRYDVDLSVQLADSTSTATSSRLPAGPLYIDNHLSSAAGGAARHPSSSTATLARLLVERRHRRPPSHHPAPSWLALHIQHRLDDDAAVETPRRGAARLALHVQGRHQPTTMPPRRRRGAARHGETSASRSSPASTDNYTATKTPRCVPARPALHAQARH